MQKGYVEATGLLFAILKDISPLTLKTSSVLKEVLKSPIFNQLEQAGGGPKRCWPLQNTKSYGEICSLHFI